MYPEVSPRIGPDAAESSRLRGDALRQPAFAHVVQEATHVVAREVTFERPGGVGVADGQSEVGHALDHHPLVGEPGRRVDDALRRR